MANTQRDFRAIIDELQRQEWTLEQTTKGHYRAKPPDGQKIVHFCLSGDPRAVKNTISDLRRSGFEWPPRPRNDSVVPLQRRPITSLGSVVQAQEKSDEDDSLGEDSRPTMPQVVAQAAPVPDPSSEQSLDDLWAALKDAKTSATLAEEYLAECARGLEEARKRHVAAQEESRAAMKALAGVKKAFDAAFSAPEEKS